MLLENLKQSKLGAIQLHTMGMPAKAQFVDVAVSNFTAKFKVDSGVEVPSVSGDFPTVPAELNNVESLVMVSKGQLLRMLGLFCLARLQWQGRISSGQLYLTYSFSLPLWVCRRYKLSSLSDS